MSHQHELKPTALPRPGDILLGRYVVEGILTRGGFAAIYRGRQLGVDRIVAIKCLDPESIHLDPAAPQRFSREAKLASGLVHPNTITIFDYGHTKQGILFLVMEYIEGVSLNRVLRYGRIDADRGAHLITQMLHSLREAHAKGIVHRDLKPANVMVCDRAGEHDVVKILDFGIAKAIGDHSGSSNLTAELTGSDRVIGSPRYMAPEQLAGEPVSSATDLYSVGLIFWEMLVGRPAVDKGSPLENMTAQLSDDPIPIPPEVHASYQALLKRALEKNPRDRFQSADEFLDVLSAAVAGEDQSSSPGRVSRPVAEARTASVAHEVGEELRPEPLTPSGLAPPVPMVPSGAYSALGYGGLGGRPRLLMLFNVLLAVLLVAVGVTLGVVIVTQVTARPTVTQALAPPAPSPQAPVGYAVPGGGVLAHGGPTQHEGAAIVRQPRLEVEAARLQVSHALLIAANTAEPLVFVFQGEPVDADVYIGPDRIGRAGEPVTIARQRLPAEIEIARSEYESSFMWINSASTRAVAFRLDPVSSGRRRSARGEDAAAPAERVRTGDAGTRWRASPEAESTEEVSLQIGVIDTSSAAAPTPRDEGERPSDDDDRDEASPPSALSPL